MTTLDTDSIRILRELENGEKTAPELANHTNLSRGQVHYRLQNKLSDRVTQTEERENPGSAPPTTVWALSEEGRAELGDLDETPETFEEIAERASEASEDAKSAKESVQNYRKTVNRMKERQDIIKGATGLSWDDLEQDTILTGEELRRIYGSIDGLKERLQDDLDELDDELNELADDLDDTSRERAELRDAINKTNRRLDRMETRLNNHESATNNRLDRIERRLTAVENRSLRDFLPF